MPERARKTRPDGRSEASRRFRRVRAVFSVVLGSTVQPGSASGAKVGVRIDRDVATRAKVRHFTFSLNRFRQNSAPLGFPLEPLSPRDVILTRRRRKIKFRPKEIFAVQTVSFSTFKPSSAFLSRSRRAASFGVRRSAPKRFGPGVPARRPVKTRIKNPNVTPAHPIKIIAAVFSASSGVVIRVATANPIAQIDVPQPTGDDVAKKNAVAIAAIKTTLVVSFGAKSRESNRETQNATPPAAAKTATYPPRAVFQLAPTFRSRKRRVQTAASGTDAAKPNVKPALKKQTVFPSSLASKRTESTFPIRRRTPAQRARRRAPRANRNTPFGSLGL